MYQIISFIVRKVITFIYHHSFRICLGSTSFSLSIIKHCHADTVADGFDAAKPLESLHNSDSG